MGSTIAEKILASHSDRAVVRPGEYIWARVDETNAVQEPLVLKGIKELGIDKVFDPERVYSTIDHSSPPQDIAHADSTQFLRDWTHRVGSNFYEIGRHGIQHHVLPESGYVRPGELIMMADSHSTTYGAFNAASACATLESVFVIATGTSWFRVPESIRIEFVGELPEAVLGKDIILDIARRHGTDFALYKSVEYGGPGLHSMKLHDRWTISNMGVELGAKFAICEADDVIYRFLEGRTDRPYTPVFPDADATYSYSEQIDLSKLEPLVALPGDPSNGIPVSSVDRGTKVNQVFIGSCSEGRFENFELAARVLKGRKVHPDVRLLASPGSQAVWRECLQAGIWDTFTEAGALVMHSTCGPCQGGHLGVLGAGEVCVSTGPRNFAGRMGDPTALIYEANAAVAAAAAVAGEITDPRDFL